MPGKRAPNKKLASFWMHKDIFAALRLVTEASGSSKSRYIVEALAEKMGFSLDAAGYPVDLDLGLITRKASKQRKCPTRGKKLA